MALRIYVAGALLLAASVPVAAASGPEMLGKIAAEPSTEPFAEAVVELQINDQSVPTTLIVRRDTDGTILLRAADLPDLRLRTPARGAVVVNGERYYRLGAELGAVVAFDERTQVGKVMLPAQAFLPTQARRADPDAPRPVQPAPGGFANYDVSVQQDDRTTQAGGFFELGLFGTHGVVTNTLVARSEHDGHGPVQRLDTTWTRDFPDRLATLRVGDTISTPGPWGRAVRFGGVQFGTNFGTQPSLVTTPLLAAQGEAVVPSTVDVFVNGRQVASEAVPPGPFSIDRLPLVTGAGQLQVVVTDALGRQQVLTQPYYSGAALLRPGLAEYSLELGSQREDYGLSAFEYGDLIGVASYRRGLSDNLTAGARLEAQSDGTFALGGDAAWQAGRVGVLTSHLAAGGSTDESGLLAGVGIEHYGSWFNAFAQTQYTSRDFVQLGSTLLEQKPRQRTFAGIGVDLESRGNLQLAYGLQSFHDAASVETLGLSYSVNLGTLGYLGLFATHATADSNDSSVLLTWTMSLGDRRTISSALRQSSAPTSAGGGFEAYTTLQRDLPSGTGTGYRVSLSSADEQDANLVYQGRAGMATLDYARRNGATGVRLGATGGLAITSAGVMPSRQLEASFAVVQVADYADLTVYLDNQPIGRTDAKGRVLVDALRPYERNEISVDPTQVPMDGAIDQAVIGVTPAYRSGALVRFPVTRAYAVTMRLVQADGTPVPPGASATLTQDHGFPVALEGLLYLEGLQDRGLVQVTWQGGACSCHVRRPTGTDPVPDLGTVTCR
jgi:outer membrane usher protein